MVYNVKEVDIYTDGACSGNPGPGGWGVYMIYGKHEKKLSGGEAHTTNNRMEMLAAIKALESLKETCKVNIYTDSNYLKQGIETWIHNWRLNNWRTKDKKPVKNVDLWQELTTQLERHEVKWFWVRGHGDNYGNNMADMLAVNARDEAKKIK